VIIAIAGHETTANLLGTAMIRLLTPRLDGVRPIAAIDTIDTIDDRIITELLRLDDPVQAVGRTATADHVINGITIHAGEPALVVLAAANRDPARPDQLQPDRAGPAPLTFGYGAHYCLGAALARLEIAIALQHVLAPSIQPGRSSTD